MAGDNDSDGIAVAGALTIAGATIRDAAANDATLTLTAPNTTGVFVDTTAPPQHDTEPRKGRISREFREAL